MNMKRIATIIIMLTVLSGLCYAKGKKWQDPNAGRSPISLGFHFGYAIPINASYIDTYQNDDIYWNPNSGINLDLRMSIKCNDYLWVVLPIDFVAGFYRYKTTDGRKVNTEAQAGNAPDTMNNEWSVAPNFVPMVHVRPGKHPAIPYIGLGLGIGFLWSFESWEFTNADGKNALLMIAKYYWPTPLFKGEIGWKIPVKNGVSIEIGATFNLANFIMRRVELTNYYINGRDTIGNFDEKDKVYSYSFNAPDENKGGDCLLAGFAYKNYPQQKISTNVSIKFGVSYTFEKARKRR